MISSLIVSIITIALMLSILYAGINYINIDSYENSLMKAKIPSDIYSLELGIETYKETYNIYPSNIDWKKDLNSINVIIPESKKTTYSYESKNGNIGICLEKIIYKESQFNVILDIQNKGQTILSENCFSKTNTIKSIDTYPTRIALTKWIK